jgi:hypothetical protein
MGLAKPLIPLFGLALITALTTGCHPTLSIHALYTKEDLVSDLPLEGNWMEEDEPGDGILYQVRKNADGYEVILADPGEPPVKLDMHLVRLREFRFLDIATPAPDVAIPGHMFARVWMEGDGLRIAMMDQDWVWQRMFESGFAVRLGTGQDSQMILTAPTRELQMFVLSYAADPAAFGDPGRLHAVH